MTSPETTFPRDGLRAATLQFPRGLTNLSTEVGDTGDHLVIASFTGPQPELGKTGDIVSIRYPHNREQTTGRLTIADDVAWTFDIHKGVSSWNLDLRNGVVTELHSDGGATAWALQLPDPEREGWTTKLNKRSRIHRRPLRHEVELIRSRARRCRGPAPTHLSEGLRIRCDASGERPPSSPIPSPPPSLPPRSRPSGGPWRGADPRRLGG